MTCAGTPHSSNTPWCRKPTWSATRSAKPISCVATNIVMPSCLSERMSSSASRFSGGQSVISEAWIVATFCEIPLMLFCAWLMRRHGLRAVITFGLLGTVLKLVLTGIAGSRGVYFLGLMVHGCFFSGALVGFNLYVDQRFPVADRPSLQALGTLFYQGIPTALAGLAVGTVWHFWGLRSVFWIAGMIAMMTGVTAFKLLPRLSSSRA